MSGVAGISRMSDGGDNRVDFEDRTASGLRVHAPVELVQRRAAGISNLFLVIQSRGFLVVDPLEGHASHIRAKDELGEAARRQSGDYTQVIVVAVIGAFKVDA